jgi:pectinesterase
MLLGLVCGAGLRAAAPDAVVAADGPGKYRTVQDAIDAAPQLTSASGPRWTIFVKNGTYRERLYVQREKRFVSLVGEDAAKTVITFDLFAKQPGPDGRPIGTFRTPTVQVDADDFTLQNLTLANSAGPVGQALALRLDGDRITVRGCRLLGWQDTLLVNRGRHYFADCYIEGHVDFIFGGATAYFERCHLHCLKDGYITAASTPEGQAFGLVFADCRITGAPGVRSYLGRPWRDFAGTVFLRSEMSDVIRPEGWNDWEKPQAHKTARYFEFADTGPGSLLVKRVSWLQPSASGAGAAFSPAAVLAGGDGWNPAGWWALHLAGDSTMADKPDLDYPERGWGQLLRERVEPTLELVNHAVNGRSTKSFRDLGHWDALLAQLKPGDWVIIQFGHNDAKQSDPTRYTDPATDYPANLRRFVSEVRARQAQPILATPVVRRSWTAAGALQDTHGAYLEAVRKVAQEQKVPLLDMEKLTRKWLVGLGPEQSKKFFMQFAPGEHPRLPQGINDNTHFVEAGARQVASLAVDEIHRLGLPLGGDLLSTPQTGQSAIAP